MTYITDKEAATRFWSHCCDYLGTKTNLEFVSDLATIEDRTKPQELSMEDFYERLLKSLVNRQGMPNSIGQIQRLRNVLCDFCPTKVSETYGSNWKQLFRTIRKDVKPSSHMNINSPQNYWVVFSKGALDGARFLSSFASEKALESEITQFADSEAFRAGLPKVLALEIHGYGFSLACDFLKECGWTQYAKADTHTKKILKYFGFSDGTDYDTFQAIQSIARHVNKTPYAVDKYIWLIGSGKLYNRHETLQTNRDDFFRFCKRRIGPNEKSKKGRRMG